ncbi:hypothetical protein BC831DRAFT_459496 [Entophlyctis helioformis]|nr:hypothetical protein BC831DRAFT_459496 [Entophlyctis helioformis]
MSTAAQVDLLVAKLTRRLVVGSIAVALETARLLRNVVSGSKWKDNKSLTDAVRNVGIRLESTQPIEMSALGMVKRVLHLIQEEQLVYVAENPGPEPEGNDYREKMKSALRQAISEMIDELETASSNIASQALEHIHSNEIILTVGGSPVVEQFLKEAAKLRRFQVLVTEAAPWYDGQEMAASLAAAGIDTTLVTDSAIFAVMSRANKVILGAHAVLANGGVVAVSGSHIVASSAKHHSTPVVVLAGLHTISPTYPYDTGVFNLCVSPNAANNFENAEKLKDVDLPTPLYDYVAPEFVSLFITNIGPHPPTYIQRLVSESYLE